LELYLDEKNPMKQMDRLKEIKIFIMVDEDDDVMPIEKSKEFYEEIKDISEYNRFKIYEGMGHVFDEKHMEDGIEYLKEVKKIKGVTE